MENNLLAVSYHLTGGSGHSLQRLDGGLRLTLLHNAQNSVQQHHCNNDNDLCPLALSGQHAGNSGYGGGNHQNNQHGVLQLGEKALNQRRLFALFQLVGAILLLSLLYLLVIQAIGVHAQILQNLLGGQGVGFLHRFPLLIFDKKTQKTRTQAQNAVHESHSTKHSEL